MRLAFLTVAALLVAQALAQSNPQVVTGGTQRPGPFTPPAASIHYAPDRTCDLIHLRVDLDVDYPNRTLVGHAENTMTPLRNISEVVLNAGPMLQISRVTLNGRNVSFQRTDRILLVSTGPLVKGKQIVIGIDYKSERSRAASFAGGGGGFHWIEPQAEKPDHVGFWTQGESMYNSNWAPTWDYPNDFTTSETHTTVPAEWSVVGNGVLTSNTLSPDGKRRTFVWKLDEPHATYLLSVVGGPFDIKQDKWRGVPLMYVVPKSDAPYSAYTFSGTKDMLSFYSDTLGVKYAWPKYAQDAMYDFGGGMENVSATTMAEGAMTDPRDGFRRSDSLISHEMAHQWFGDLVTCKDWGDIFLNESFATFMQMMYFEHSRGKNGYDEEVDNNTRGYLFEAQRYKRPISTKLYPNAEAMFDQHTYPKGGVVLHTLRRQLGDEAFFSGLHQYLTNFRHQPVQASQLCRTLTESSGINCEPFFDQWIFRPGHPVLDYTWTWDDAAKTAVVTVKQTQDTSDGTPIYTIPAKIGLISGGKCVRASIQLNAAQQEFRIASTSKPDALLLDPDHDFLRQIQTLHWSREELLPIVQSAPEGGDRTEALRQLMGASPTDAEVQAAVDAVQQDKEQFPSFRTILALSSTARPNLRAFFEGQLDHASFPRRAEAVTALSRLPQDPGTTAKLRALINPQAPIAVVIASIRALADFDAKGNVDVFQKALAIQDIRGQIKRAAQAALDKAK